MKFRKFRNCWMLPIYNGGGKLLKEETIRFEDEFLWTAAAEQCPIMREVIEGEIFSWMRPKGRVTILRTPGRSTMNTHIDCPRTSMSSFDYKFRMVLRGRTDSLFLLDSDGESRIYAPADTPLYIIDGGHPHGMVNADETEKLTLCIGFPWLRLSTGQEYLLKPEKSIQVTRPALRSEWCHPRYE